MTEYYRITLCNGQASTVETITSEDESTVKALGGIYVTFDRAMRYYNNGGTMAYVEAVGDKPQTFFLIF